MRVIIGLLLCGLVAGATVVASTPGYPEEMPVYVLPCDEFEIRLAAAHPAKGPAVIRHGDGSVSVHSTRGGVTSASCELGCLEVAVDTSCAIVRPRPAQPSFTVSCAGDEGETFELDPGSDSTSCSVELDARGDVLGGACDDGEGNSTSVDCSANGGGGTCVGVNGSADCTCTSCD